MNILYLHGLKSKLSDQKRQVLEKYGTVYAPDLDYNLKHILPELILEKVKETEINVVIGSSMGALNSYIISDVIGRPCLLFNPPLSKHEGDHKFQTNYIKGNSFKQLALGGVDDIVDPKETLSFLSNNTSKEEIDIHIDPKLGHRIPLQLYKEQTKIFFSKLCF
ncbi:YqiA/YcfP family alpha/beta fold hydrolase [Gillisia sp. Hel_I_29]|uniref:YqiA/YcfP family alpha/beta fold hydrolase n=1 Tax=Gillisia sp. Hel_I_29 TaxID=1249975 RepID=UPI000558421A|nr:YqiA/YcfP family alpha/beta fold hydrolase [Gillisia sp. Hel_I_29]